MTKANGQHFSLWLDRDADAEALAYLDTCARLRNITRHSLLRRLVKVIARDQLVLSVLDDADNLKERRAGEHSYRSHSPDIG